MSDDTLPPPSRDMFDELTFLNGLTLPEDRKEAMYDGFVGLRAMAAELRRPRTAAAEPAGIFVPQTIGRKEMAGGSK